MGKKGNLIDYLQKETCVTLTTEKCTSKFLCLCFKVQEQTEGNLNRNSYPGEYLQGYKVFSSFMSFYSLNYPQINVTEIFEYTQH